MNLRIIILIFGYLQDVRAVQSYKKYKCLNKKCLNGDIISDFQVRDFLIEIDSLSLGIVFVDWKHFITKI